MNPFTFPMADEIPEAARIDVTRWDRQWLCDGEIRTWEGETAPVRSPVCVMRPGVAEPEPVELGRIAMIDRAAGLEALAAAKAAWSQGRGAWPTMRVGERIERMTTFVTGMRAVREDLVRLLMWEIGKSRADSETEVDRTVVYIQDTIEALKELDRTAARFSVTGGFVGQIRRSPLGVVLCMGPFNYPLNETFTTLIPALVMGNTIVSKLPRFGQLVILPLLAAFRDAFPAGAVNIFQADGPAVIGPIMESGDIDCLAFIGSSRVANLLKRQHPRLNRMRSITGLESKNPAVILPSADLDQAVKECVSGALSFNGQRCTAIKLVFAHADIADDFVARLAKAVDALPAGMPWEKVTLTPLPEPGRPAYMRGLVDDAVAHGAKVVGSRAGGTAHGTFFRPAVVFPVAPAARLYKEEQFGPVVPVTTFRELDEIDHFMRTSPYGQQIALFGTDPRQLAQLVDALVNSVCRINVNTQCRRGPDVWPFTGRKDSAEGTLSVSDALRAFSIRTVVATTATEPNQDLVGEIVTRRLSSFLTTDFLF
ncbi:MAG: aldehyde dehydrogenase family protein [Deltaproteobacteria bacterium]|nr:aldehyde dehydrogenase family protein [Kofleriaceae bacterium]